MARVITALALLLEYSYQDDTERGDTVREVAADARVEYDAERARAEAAERDLAASHKDAAWQESGKVSAESRLAEATALLELVTRGKPLADGTAWYKAYADFLSAAPAQAAEPERGVLRILFDGPPGPESGRFVECEDAIGCSVNAGEWSEEAGYHVLTVKRLPGASTAGSSYPNCCNPPHTVPLDEHPDTIALRECRAELEAVEAECNYQRTRAKDAERSRDTARAERDKARLELVQCAGERPALIDALETGRARLRSALARIAELETALAGATAVHHDFAGLKTRIARAVAILEADKDNGPSLLRRAAFAALEALR